MKVAILGSRGIPNRYGGFEELAEKLAVGLADLRHEVVVYIPSDHPIKGWQHAGVQLIRVFNPEKILGSFGQFVYDFGASVHTRSSNPDVILQLGYTSSSIWFWVLPHKAKIITNMDGLEWKRSKYNRLVQKFLLRAEKWAAKHSHLLIADNPEIEKYLHKKYKNQVIHIPYGADIPRSVKHKTLEKYGVEDGKYNLLIARMEPENHIEEILDGVHQSQSEEKILVIGNANNSFGLKLQAKFRPDKRIVFLQGIYNKDELNALRFHSRLYFHGHSVGGTNPSLLEAMACSCFIVAHKNKFNKSVLSHHAWFFSNAEDVANLIDKTQLASTRANFLKQNLSTIRDKFNWRIIIEQYEIAMQQSII